MLDQSRDRPRDDIPSLLTARHRLRKRVGEAQRRPATNDDVRDAINDPMCYRHYAQLFDARMAALTQAIERGGRAQVQGGRRQNDTGAAEETTRRVAPGVQGAR